jgi:hypothetical protein
VNNLRTGYKVQVDNRTAVTESDGTVTLDVDTWALPATTIKVYDSNDVLKAELTPSGGIYGGDVYNFFEPTESGQVFLVPEVAQNVQPAPRAFQRGSTVHEVGAEWGDTGTVELDVWYTRGPAQLDESGAFSQNVDLPDRWVHVLEYKLVAYLVRKDGRPQEAKAWDDLAVGAIEALTMYLKMLHGEGEPEE